MNRSYLNTFLSKKPDQDYGVRLDGVASLIPIALTSGLALTPTENFSISIWHRCMALDGGYIWSQDKASSSFGPNFRLVANANGTAQFYLRNDANSVIIDKASTDVCIKLGFWQHFLFTHASGAGNLIVDGKDVNSAGNWNHGAPGTCTFDKMTFGAQVRATTLAYHKGDFGQIAIIKRVLTVAEAKDIYIKNLFPSDAKTLFLTFPQGYGTTSADQSGNGNTATLTSLKWIQNFSRVNGQINQQ